MPKVDIKENFIRELKKFTTTNGNSNIISEFTSNKIKIEETESDGIGEIFLDISTYTDDTFFIKIDNKSEHNIGIKRNHNDGIVLKVNLDTQNISVFLFELKKQLRWSNLEKASTQLACSYRFIKYLQLEECFSVDYTFFVVYESNNITLDSDVLKTRNQFQLTLFSAIYENENKIPIQIPLCKYKKFPFKQVVFGETILI